MPLNKLNKWVAECELILPLSKSVQSQGWLRAAISNYLGFTCEQNLCSVLEQSAQYLPTSALTLAWQQKPTEIQNSPAMHFKRKHIRGVARKQFPLLRKSAPKSWDNGPPHKSIAQTTQEYSNPAYFPYSTEIYTGIWFNVVYCQAEGKPEKPNLNFPSRMGKAFWDWKWAEK